MPPPIHNNPHHPQPPANNIIPNPVRPNHRLFTQYQSQGGGWELGEYSMEEYYDVLASSGQLNEWRSLRRFKRRRRRRFNKTNNIIRYEKYNEGKKIQLFNSIYGKLEKKNAKLIHNPQSRLCINYESLLARINVEWIVRRGIFMRVENRSAGFQHNTWLLSGWEICSNYSAARCWSIVSFCSCTPHRALDLTRGNGMASYKSFERNTRALFSSSSSNRTPLHGVAAIKVWFKEILMFEAVEKCFGSGCCWLWWCCWSIRLLLANSLAKHKNEIGIELRLCNRIFICTRSSDIKCR